MGLMFRGVPLSGDKDPRIQGILTVIYVDGVVCKVLCPYIVALQSTVMSRGCLQLMMCFLTRSFLRTESESCIG